MLVFFTEEAQNCPTRSYSGIWEMPINQMEFEGRVCEKIASCSKNLTSEQLYRLLMHNFKRHYLTNKAPYGLHINSKWLKHNSHLAVFEVSVSYQIQRY